MPFLPQKRQQTLRDLLPIGLKSEMSRIHKLHQHIRWILPERLCPGRDKNDIVLAPDCEQWHLANFGNSTETVGFKSTFVTVVFQQVELDVLERSYILQTSPLALVHHDPHPKATPNIQYQHPQDQASSSTTS